MRKGQMEIIGLVVIVIILVFIFFIYLGLSGGNDDTEKLRDTQAKIEIPNFLQSILLYTVCADTDLGDVMKTCLEGTPEICGKNSCELAESEFKMLLSAYMEDQGWQETYYILEKKAINGQISQEGPIFEGGEVNCLEITAGGAQITSNRGVYELRIERCVERQKTPQKTV